MQHPLVRLMKAMPYTSAKSLPSTRKINLILEGLPTSPALTLAVIKAQVNEFTEQNKHPKNAARALLVTLAHRPDLRTKENSEYVLQLIRKLPMHQQINLFCDLFRLSLEKNTFILDQATRKNVNKRASILLMGSIDLAKLKNSFNSTVRQIQPNVRFFPVPKLKTENFIGVPRIYASKPSAQEKDLATENLTGMMEGLSAEEASQEESLATENLSSMTETFSQASESDRESPSQRETAIAWAEMDDASDQSSTIASNRR